MLILILLAGKEKSVQLAEQYGHGKTRQMRHYKKGVSFLSTGKRRVKVTTEISTKQGKGSKPFIIKGQYSGKKLPVYVRPGLTKKKGAEKRKVQAMYFSSLPHLARKDWENKVQEFSIEQFKKEYPDKLKTASKGF